MGYGREVLHYVEVFRMHCGHDQNDEPLVDYFTQNLLPDMIEEAQGNRKSLGQKIRLLAIGAQRRESPIEYLSSMISRRIPRIFAPQLNGHYSDKRAAKDMMELEGWLGLLNEGDLGVPKPLNVPAVRELVLRGPPRY